MTWTTIFLFNHILMLCRQCNTAKGEGEFYKSNRASCKECVRDRSTKSRWARIEAVREYDRARGNRQSPDYVTEYRKRNPKKYKAHTALNNALRAGKVYPMPCIVCGEDAEAHHPDYDQPLDVIWLCPSHHKQVHAMTQKLEKAA